VPKTWLESPIRAGLLPQPGAIDVEVPAGASAERAPLFYWEGLMWTDVPGDDAAEAR
jgi:hypothetical protein